MSASSSPRRPTRWNARLIIVAMLVIGLALLLAIFSGFGHRWGWWDFRTGFSLLRWAAWIALAGGALALLTLLISLLRRNLREAAAGGAVALVAVAVISVPLQWMQLARSVPPIHDISTDTVDPPAFVAILPLRADAPNPPHYAGEDIATQQRAAYPDIVPLDLDTSVDAAFAIALDAARTMGWEIIDADAAAGRIEAVATTFWFGFRDDVVVRVSATESGARVDVRSKSRVGRGDAGANALRIRAFLDRIEARR